MLCAGYPASARWRAAGLDAATAQLLSQSQIVVQDLGANLLGLASPSTGKIYLDDDAAGFGWFIDSTPGLDEEFGSPAGSLTHGMDLLTTVMHEMGHLLGLADLEASDALMSDRLSTGIRRNPGSSLDIRDALLAAVERGAW